MNSDFRDEKDRDGREARDKREGRAPCQAVALAKADARPQKPRQCQGVALVRATVRVRNNQFHLICI